MENVSGLEIVNVCAVLRLRRRLDLWATAKANPKLRIEFTSKGCAVLYDSGGTYTLSQHSIMSVGSKSQADAEGKLRAIYDKLTMIFVD
jgi:hypothetical protein